MTEINAITLATADMRASVDFWLIPCQGIAFGGADAPFTTLRLGTNFVKLMAAEHDNPGFWGRIIFHVPSPDRLHAAFDEAGYRSLTEPADAPWGERYFHIRDPAGHELSFARRL